MKAKLIFLAAFIAFFAACCKLCPAKESKTPKLLCVYTSEFCAACPAVLRALADNKIATEVRPISDPRNAEWFPYCVYDNAKADAGDRIFKKQCVFKRPVVIIYEFKQEK